MGRSTKANSRRDLGQGRCFQNCDLLATGAWRSELGGTWKFFYVTVTFMAMFVWWHDPGASVSILSIELLCHARHQGFTMSKPGIVLPSCSFHSSSGRQMDTCLHLFYLDVAKSASLLKQASLFFCLWCQENHTPPGETHFNIYVKRNYILCNSNLLCHSCFFGLVGYF